MTGVESNRHGMPIALEQVCARGVEREHVRPIVRALPMPTAHASTRTISAPARMIRPEDRSARFARLQERMAAVEAAIRVGGDRRSVVVVPYGTIDEWHESPAEAQAYEERLLCSLLELRDPNLRMTYVTSSPIAPTIVDYYLSLLTRRMRRLARSRLTLIGLADRTTRPLSRSCSSVRACST